MLASTFSCTTLTGPQLRLGPRLQPIRLTPAFSLRILKPAARPAPAAWRRRPEASARPACRPAEEAASSTSESFWSRIGETLAKAAALGALAAALLLTCASPALAARSGGRMGGSAFSGRSSTSLGSSYGGTSRSYGGYSGFGGGMGRGLSAPSTRASVGVGVGASVMPSFFISPFGFGYGYPMVGGFNFMSLVFWGIFAVVMLQVVQGVLSGGGAASGYTEDGGYSDGKVTVAKVQVGLLGSARELQRDLERIASRADTESPQGLHYILQETVLALMRNPDYCIYGYSAGAAMGSAERAETRFNEYSMEERGKFEAETLVNVGGRSRRSSLKRRPGAAAGPQELIVVTILVAAEGGFKLPKITSRVELRAALARLGSVRADDVLAVEVLWTPEEKDDYFTQEDLAVDYPLLNTL